MRVVAEKLDQRPIRQGQLDHPQIHARQALHGVDELAGFAEVDPHRQAQHIAIEREHPVQVLHHDPNVSHRFQHRVAPSRSSRNNSAVALQVMPSAR